VATYAITRADDQSAIAPLLPALRSVWLQVHVLTAMVGYAAFGVAAGLGAMRLALADTRRGWPTAQEIERTMKRAVGLGFPWLTLAILTGAIWAQNAWGRYWGWDPKETWSLITWLWYLLILHLRPLRRWRGRRLAVIVVVGFGLVLFTFVGVPWLVRTVRLESLHGF
jgi:cytochrome c-type biogenesis protein CcsB